MSRLSRWFDHLTDPTDREHLVDDAGSAMHPIVAACLLVITFVVVVCVLTWFFTLEAGDGELAPVPGTTTTEVP